MMEEKGSPRRRQSPISIEPAQGKLGKWRRLSPRIASRLFGGNIKNTADGGETGARKFPEKFNFGDIQPSPGGGSPLSPGRAKRDSRRTILLNITYANLFLALVLLILGGFGPRYPGHSGTTDNAYTHGGATRDRRLTTQDSPLYLANCPTEEVSGANASVLHSAVIVGLIIWLTQPCAAYRISKQVDRAGAAATLLTSVVCAFTCLCAFAVVMVDITYIAGCCSLLEDNCEVSNLCTAFVSECCIGDDVKAYCGNPSYHVGAVSMIFLVFASTSAMVIMACTMTCRCWLDSDPHFKHAAMMMVLTGDSRRSHRGRRYRSTSPRSPAFSPCASLLAELGGKEPSSPSSRPPERVDSRKSEKRQQVVSGNVGKHSGSGSNGEVKDGGSSENGGRFSKSRGDDGDGSSGEGVGGFIGGSGGSGHGNGGGCSGGDGFGSNGSESKFCGGNGDGSKGDGGGGSSGDGGGGSNTAIKTREECALCGATFGDMATLDNHVSRFHPKGEKGEKGEKFRLELKPAALSKPITRKRSYDVPDDPSNLRVTGGGEPGVGSANK